MEPEMIYHEAEDKHRIVIAGNQAMVIGAMVTHALTQFKRSYDTVVNSELIGNQSIKDSPAPLLIVVDRRTTYQTLAGCHHHMVVISDFGPDATLQAGMNSLAGATPKAGIVIYSDRGAAAAVGKVVRPDVTSIPYTTYPSRQENGTTFLVTSTSEKFPVTFKGEEDLRCASAAKEILKKVGITSGQFYEAMTSWRPL